MLLCTGPKPFLKIKVEGSKHGISEVTTEIYGDIPIRCTGPKPFPKIKAEGSKHSISEVTTKIYGDIPIRFCPNQNFNMHLAVGTMVEFSYLSES